MGKGPQEMHSDFSGTKPTCLAKEPKKFLSKDSLMVRQLPMPTSRARIALLHLPLPGTSEAGDCPRPVDHHSSGAIQTQRPVLKPLTDLFFHLPSQRALQSRYVPGDKSCSSLSVLSPCHRPPAAIQPRFPPLASPPPRCPPMAPPREGAVELRPSSPSPRERFKPPASS